MAMIGCTEAMFAVSDAAAALATHRPSLQAAWPAASHLVSQDHFASESLLRVISCCLSMLSDAKCSCSSCMLGTRQSASGIDGEFVIGTRKKAETCCMLCTRCSF